MLWTEIDCLTPRPTPVLTTLITPVIIHCCYRHRRSSKIFIPPIRGSDHLTRLSVNTLHLQSFSRDNRKFFVSCRSLVLILIEHLLFCSANYQFFLANYITILKSHTVYEIILMLSLCFGWLLFKNIIHTRHFLFELNSLLCTQIQ